MMTIQEKLETKIKNIFDKFATSLGYSFISAIPLNLDNSYIKKMGLLVVQTDGSIYIGEGIVYREHIFLFQGTTDVKNHNFLKYLIGEQDSLNLDIFKYDSNKIVIDSNKEILKQKAFCVYEIQK